MSFVHSLIHSSIIQSSLNHTSTVISLILSLVLLVKHLLVQFALVILCFRYLVATPCSSFIRLLSLSLVTCSFSIYLSLSIINDHSLCDIPFAAVTRYFLCYVISLSLFVTRYSLLLLPKVFARYAFHTHTHTGRSKCNRPLCSMPIVPAALLFVPISSLLCCSRCSTRKQNEIKRNLCVARF